MHRHIIYILYILLCHCIFIKIIQFLEDKIVNIALNVVLGQNVNNIKLNINRSDKTNSKRKIDLYL